MESKMVGRLIMMAMALALAMAVALPASAGPAATNAVADFNTNALDADGCFRLVHCSQAHQVVKGDIARESYNCQFVDDDFWGTPVLPKSAMKWDYENTAVLENWADCTVPVEPPYRWFSDVEDILTGDLCWMYTNAKGADIGDSSFRMVITPSGNVNITVVYDPPVMEGPECP